MLDGFDFGKGWCSEHLDFFDFVLGGFDFGKRSLWPKCFYVFTVALVLGPHCYVNILDDRGALARSDLEPMLGHLVVATLWLPLLCDDLVLCSAVLTVLYLRWLVGGWLL